jgi:hypothetical protein
MTLSICFGSSFRGTLRAEESLFALAVNQEGFLTAFGMTIKESFSTKGNFRRHLNRNLRRGY